MATANEPNRPNPGQQANYRQVTETSRPDISAKDFERHNDWRDGLPHNFHGWGPQTPNLDPSPRPSRAPAMKELARPEHLLDHHYLIWRENELRKLDADYLAWRSERQGQFNQDFDAWRGRRNLARQHAAEDDRLATTPPPVHGQVERDNDPD